MKKTKLELTWIGKDKRPRLEPRILLEDKELSHRAEPPPADDLLADRPAPIYDNLLIHGDNLLALKALERDYAGKIACVYIDPPFNTGDAFENYDDGLEHSIWLGLMHERIKILRSLLGSNGSLFVHLNDDELDYCKVILDEVFGRANFVNRIIVEARSPSAFSTVNPGVFKAAEYILWYAKDRLRFNETAGRVARTPDYAYNKWLQNPTSDFSEWQLVPLMDAYANAPQSRSRRPDSVLEHFHEFIVENANRICRLASISDSGAGSQIVGLKRQSVANPGKVFRLKREGGLDDVFVLDGQQLIFYKKNVAVIDGKKTATALLTNVWKDIAWEGIANEGCVTFRKGKKPERLIRRCLELASAPGDLVLDSFAGSGTTGAVAHKMGRRWIMVELGEHCRTHIVPRLKKVIDGDDSGGVTKAVNWRGGGGFRYLRLAPSLLKKDTWGNWVINPDYNPEMLAEAMCKHMGFSYAPSREQFWNHGYSGETDFIYVTTGSLTRDQLKLLSEAVGEARTLLICCKAFLDEGADFPNLTLKKIPQAVLNKCEWDQDDYSFSLNLLGEADEPA
jgi:adenine-specific DNA-methyltransferase